METLLYYFLKVMLCSSVMFLYYRIFLKDKTFHHYNRFYLLGTLFVSLLLPLLKVDYFTIDVDQNIYALLQLLQNNSTSNISTNDLIFYPIIFSVIALVAVFFVAKFCFALWKIDQLKKEYPQEKLEGISFYMTNLENAPFSFFRNLFWKKTILLQSDLGKQILKHEMVHIEQKHSYDKIFIEIITALFWFNPIFYLIRKELNLIHEYLADKKALKNSDTKAFAQMLLETHFSGKVLPGTSPFLNSNLKKRITMLKRSNTKFAYFRKVFALPLLFMLVFTYMVKAENREIRKTNDLVSQKVFAIKKDTLIPKIEEKEKTINTKDLQKNSKDLKIDSYQDLDIKQTITANDRKANALKKFGDAPIGSTLNNADVYYLNGNEVSFEKLKDLDMKSLQSISSKKHGKLKRMWIKSKDIDLKDQLKKYENNGDLYLTENPFISPPQRKNEPSTIVKNDDSWIINVDAVAIPKKVFKVDDPSINFDKELNTTIASKENIKKENTGYYTGIGVWTDSGNSKKEIGDLTEEELLKLKIFVNGKETDWKTVKEQNPKLIKQLLEKHNNNNDVNKTK